MGILDDLKKQAEAKLNARADNEKQAAKNNFPRAQELLKEASRYFAELAQTLNVLKPDVRRQFYIEGSTKLSNLLQGDYTTRDSRKALPGGEALSEVSLRFSLVNNEKLEFEKEERLITRMKEYLWAYSLPFDSTDIRDDHGRIVRGKITVHGKVQASIAISSDWDKGVVHLTLRNVELLGDVKQSFDINVIKSDFLEEIGKAVLAQPNRLRDYGRPADAPLLTSFTPPKI